MSHIFYLPYLSSKTKQYFMQHATHKASCYRSCSIVSLKESIERFQLNNTHVCIISHAIETNTSINIIMQRKYNYILTPIESITYERKRKEDEDFYEATYRDTR